MIVEPEHSPVILFVDDEATAVKYFHRAIGAMAPVVTAGSVDEGIQLLDAHAATLQVLVSDQRMPGRFGNELLRYAREHYPHMVRILTTAYSELEYTVEAINEGQIHRYIKKPWEITALRMELKQALELANLRRERDGLLQEKMLVRQKQTLANRIGSLNIICAGLMPQAHFAPLEVYLSAAHMVGLTAPEPNWMVMDYSDLIATEAGRSGGFSHAVLSVLDQLHRQYPVFPQQQALEVLASLMAGHVKLAGEEAVFADPALLTEFLAAPIDGGVSGLHANWLAYLIWLHAGGCSLQCSQTTDGPGFRLRAPQPAVRAASLADWIEQF